MMNKIKFIVSIIAFLFAFQSFAQEAEKAGEQEPEKKLLFFSNDGCGKCSTSQQFFDKNHMPYEKLAIKENRSEMYKYVHLKTHGKNVGVGYPVLVYGDSIYFSIKNLTQTLEEIKKMMEEDGTINKATTKSE